METLDQLRADSQSLESLLERQSVLQNSLQAHADRLRTGSVSELHQESNVLPIANYETERGSDLQTTDPVRGRVYSRPPTHKDDLKRISGIGQVLEEKLNRLGIYTYEQIMNWDQQAVDEFSKLLTFKDRIERDEWLVQAGKLHEETHEARKAA